ncbi:MAG: branched-chain amino acid ABC transporter ATP-binding protein/permease [Clostridia bacterium]|nr:branched-chain amino acid ABC transporter ATP-binding protein/permease [Clostridia bacterium]
MSEVSGSDKRRTALRLFIGAGALALGYLGLTWLYRAGVLSDYHVQIIIWIGINVIMGASLNLINGFTGQFSLGHAGFMAIGAYIAAYMTKMMGLPFPLALLAGGIGAAVGGVLVGVPTLRLHGDYLAIATLGFGEIIRVAIVNIEAVGGSRGMWAIPANTSMAWAYWTAAAVVLIIRNMIWSKQGRAFVAIREDETAAEAVGIDTTRYKILAFIIGAFFAGVAGGLYAHKITFIDPRQFDFMKSIESLVVIVLGGLGSLTGTVVAAVIVTMLPELLRGAAEYRMVIYSLMLIVMMIYRPKGLMGTTEFSFASLGLGNGKGRSAPSGSGGQPELERRRPLKLSDEVPVLEACDLSRSFGGLQAVSKFSVALRHGELVGLIGPNGAGKTTVFNMLTGMLDATSGEVRLMGKTITNRKASHVAAMGMARTFQNIRLFNSLSVLDNVRTAFHGECEYSMAEAVIRAGRYGAQEEQIRVKSLELLKLLHLDDKADEMASSLPYGAQRRLEIARALATGPRVLLLDEPAAGMNPQETSELSELILWIRDRFGLTILLIEHDMSLVMKLCERIVVLDYGITIAEGSPEEIRRNRRVVEAYLGEEVC